ncbi:MAG: HAMP domain-containing histidine kinase [Alteromonadaceae bacterium]|nr:HAMP domain-containing histidine kinase [Alteromonadaceae bacterium]
MSQSRARLSIKNTLLWLVITSAGGALLVSTIITNYLQHEEVKQQLLDNVHSLAAMLAATAKPILLTDSANFEAKLLQNEHLAQVLSGLESYPAVLNAHIYSAKELDTPELRAPYTNSAATPVNSKINEMARYFTARISKQENVVEIVRPINQNETTLGYVYLRVSADFYHRFVSDILIVQGTVFILVLLIAIMIAFKYSQMLISPIQSIVMLLQKVGRTRDYSIRFTQSHIREYNLMLDAINLLLSRVEEYVEKQQLAEHQHRELNSRLEDEVSQRTVALKSANSELISTLEKLHQFQHQIVENEKMASLGDMVAGVAHEVNTPIGLGITASTMMLDRLAVIDQQFKDKTLKASSMQRFISESRENLNIIYRNLDRAAQLISSFKQVAVDQSSEEPRDINVRQLIDETLMSLQPRLKKVSHQISIECAPTLNVTCKAGPLNQILINLVMNSLIHAFENIEVGHIDIKVSLTDEQKLKIIYSDNGNGIPDGIKNRIFDPFVTTKRGQGGSGLGMHLVFNLVTQALNGNIRLHSEKGKGVEFTVIIPVGLKKQ